MDLHPCPTPDPNLALPLQQHPAYAAALGRAAEAIVVRDANGPVAYALIMRGPLGARVTLRGPIWLRSLCQAERVRAIRTLRLRMMEAEAPDCALPHAGFRQIVTPAHIAEWDLTVASDARAKAMSGKWRNAWRQACSAPIKIEQRPFHGDADHPIFALTAAHAKAQGYRPVPATVAVGLAQLALKASRLFTALHQRQPIAHILMVQLGPVVTYQIGWSGPEGRRFNAHHRLLSEAAAYYAERGCRYMDLGRVDTEAAPGLARFKIGTGAAVRPLGGSHLRLWP